MRMNVVFPVPFSPEVEFAGHGKRTKNRKLGVRHAHIYIDTHTPPCVVALLLKLSGGRKQQLSL